MSDLEDRYLRKILARIIPLLFLGIFMGFIDRGNIAYAALQMNADLDLSPTIYGWAAGLFFLGYFFFEIPGTAALVRVGARIWLSMLVFCWGVISIATAFVEGPYSYFALRFALGLAEAGFFPGSILFMSYWVPRRYRARFSGYFIIAVPIALIVSGPMAGALMQLNDIAGLRGWQWLFLLEGIPCLMLAAILFLYLADHPSKAHWLTDDEKAFIERDHIEEERERTTMGEANGWRSLLDFRLLLLAILFFGGGAVTSGMIFWLPQVIASFGMSTLETGMLSTLPYAAAGFGLWYWSSHSDKIAWKWRLSAPLFISAVGLAATLAVTPPATKYALMLLASFGMSAYLPVGFAASGLMVNAKTAPVGYALMNMSGALAGFSIPILLGVFRQYYGDFQTGILSLAIIAIICGLSGAICGLFLAGPRQAQVYGT